MPPRLSTLAILIGLAAAPAGPALAQNLLQPAPLTHFIRAPDAPAQRPAAAPAAPAAPAYVLRRLPNNAQGLRLPGEVATSEWPLYITQAQAQQHLRFQLGFLSAIANLPEASILTVQINDVKIGEVRVDAPYKVKTVSIDIPDGLITPGFNALRLVAEHRHRADCSLQAT